MFERTRREEGDSGDSTAPASQYSPPAASSRPASRSGEVAVIGRSIQINGDLRGNEDLRIEGDVSGTVELKNSNLTIGKEGKVRADVYAKSIAVDGTTEGDLYASERVIVHINAKVRGNITAPRVGIEEGARFKGSIEMDPDEVAKALGKANMQGTAGPANDSKPAKPDTKAAAKNGSRDVTSATTPASGVARQP